MTAEPISDLVAMTDEPIPGTRLAEALAEIERLRIRILELETEQAIAHGTLAQPTPDEPATYVHDVPPNAPR